MSASAIFQTMHNLKKTETEDEQEGEYDKGHKIFGLVVVVLEDSTHSQRAGRCQRPFLI